MNEFISIMDSITTNENGGKAYTTTGSEALDLFYKIGVFNKSTMEDTQAEIEKLFNIAYDKDPVIAMGILLHSRAITDRGVGVRFYFREIIKNLLKCHPKETVDLLVYAIKQGWGYWDDFYYIFDYALQEKLQVRKQMASIAHKAIAPETFDNLAAKWFPRKGRVWQYMRNAYPSAKALRKLIITYQSVESKINNGDFEQINYSTVPSLSFKRNASIFQKHDSARFEAFLTSAAEGTVTVKANAIFPHQILCSFNTDNVKIAQWKGLPNIVKSGTSYLPILDCSGSMIGEPLDICYALGIYLSERNKSEFKDKVLTFSNNPRWVTLNGTIIEKQQQLMRYGECANTDFEKVFRLILTTAKTHSIPQEDMPTHLVCLTDGQFDSMTSNRGAYQTVYEKYKDEFKNAGYTLPHIIFWNLRNDTNSYVQTAKQGVTMIAGASQNAFAEALKGLDSVGVMMESIKPFLTAAATYIQSIK